MKRKIVVEGMTLAYVEVNPHQSQTLFFVHNNSGSSTVWSRQLADPNFSKYRLIAIDLPAHGESSGSDTPELHYGLSDLGRVIGKVVKELAGNDNYITVGFSIGTSIIAEALAYINPKGLVLAAPTVVGQNVNIFSIGKPDVDSSPMFSDAAPQESVTQLFALFPFSKDPALLEALLQDYHKVKAPFRSTMFDKSFVNGNMSDEVTLLRDAGVPALVVVGEEEEVIRPNYLDNVDLNKWNNTIYKIPAAGHFVQLDQPKVFNKLLLEYATEAFKEGRS